MPLVLTLAQDLAIWALPVLSALCGAAMAASWAAGRPRWNPLAHVEPLGTVLAPTAMVAFGGLVVGWPRTAAVAADAPRRRLLHAALAGPAANLVMAAAWALLLRAAIEPDGPRGPWSAVAWVATAGVQVNLAFLALSALPVPGLAGARAIAALAPARLGAAILAAERHRLLIDLCLLALLAGGVVEFVLQWPLLLAEGALFGVLDVNPSLLL